MVLCSQCGKSLHVDGKNEEVGQGYHIDDMLICDQCDNKYKFRKKWCNSKNCRNWTIFRNEYCTKCEREYNQSVAVELKLHIPQMLPELRNIILGFFGEPRLQLWQISQ